MLLGKNLFYLLLVLSILINFNFALSENAEKIKIGVIAPFTGSLATLGTAIKNGIKLAEEEQPGLFQNIQFQYEDDQLDGKLSITSYRKLKTSFNADIIFGFGTVLAHSIGPLVEKDKMPLINFNFEAEPVIGKHYILRTMNHTYEYIDTLNTYLKKDYKEELLIVSSEYSFFNIMIANLEKAAGDSISLKQVAKYNPQDFDFRASILKLKAKNAKQVGLFLFPQQIITFLKQAKELDFHAQYFGTDLFETAAGLTKEVGLLDDCLYPDNNVSKELRSRYKNKFGDEVQLTFAINAYEITLLVANLLNEKQFNNNDFINSFKSISDHPSSLGNFSYKQTKDFGNYLSFPIHVKSIQGTIGIPIDEIL